MNRRSKKKAALRLVTQQVAGNVALSDRRSSITQTGSWPTNTGGRALYPEMRPVPKPESQKPPPLDVYGAPGTTIFSGIVDPLSVGEYNSDFGWLRGIEIFDTMLRSEGQIRAIYAAMMQPFLRAKWTIKPGSEDKAHKEQAAFIESCLFHEMQWESRAGQRKYQTWPDILRHAISMLAYGFSVFKVNWRQDDGWIKWAQWTPITARSVWRWWVDEGMDLAGIQQWTFAEGKKQLVDIGAEELLHLVYDPDGKNPEGKSAFRNAYQHWYYKINYYKIQAIAIERAAVSPPVVTLPPNPTADQITIAQDIAKNVRVNEDMGITLEDGMRIEILKGGQRQATPVDPAIQHHDMLIARSVLAQWINLGSNETGSYALAETQMLNFLSGLQHVAEYFSAQVDCEIRRLVDWNFGTQEVYPCLQCSKFVSQDITTITSALKDLVQVGVIEPSQELQDYITDELGLPTTPRSEVETTNPGFDDGGDAGGDDTDQQDEQDNQGDESYSEARLLREALDRVYGMDAVALGLDAPENLVTLRGAPHGAPHSSGKGTRGSKAGAVGPHETHGGNPNHSATDGRFISGSHKTAEAKSTGKRGRAPHEVAEAKAQHMERIAARHHAASEAAQEAYRQDFRRNINNPNRNVRKEVEDYRNKTSDRARRAEYMAAEARYQADRLTFMHQHPHGLPAEFHPDTHALQRARSTRGVEHWLTANYPDTQFHLGGVGLRNAREMAMTFAEMSRLYPGAMRSLRAVGSTSDRRIRANPLLSGHLQEAEAFRHMRGWMASVEAVAGHPGQSTMLLNGRAFHNAGLTNLSMRQSIKGGHTAVGRPEHGMRFTIAHEFGHVFEHWADHSPDRYIRTGYHRIWNRGGTRGEDHISKYATANKYERFAEGFAALRYGSHAARAHSFTRALEEYLTPIIAGGES